MFLQVPWMALESEIVSCQVQVLGDLALEENNSEIGQAVFIVCIAIFKVSV